MFRRKKKQEPTVMVVSSNNADNSPGHCEHCTGKFGRCACQFGCPVKEGLTRCSAVSKHCHHCSGNAGDCSCPSNCPARPDSQCTAVHTGVYCVSCAHHETTTTPTSSPPPAIRGPRFKCMTCGLEGDPVNFCMQCYYEGRSDHPRAHQFIKIERPGSEPVLVPCRGGDTQSVIESGSPMPDICVDVTSQTSRTSHHGGNSSGQQQQRSVCSNDEKAQVTELARRYTEELAAATAATAAASLSSSSGRRQHHQAKFSPASANQTSKFRAEADQSDTSQPRAAARPSPTVLVGGTASSPTPIGGGGASTGFHNRTLSQMSGHSAPVTSSSSSPQHPPAASAVPTAAAQVSPATAVQVEAHVATEAPIPMVEVMAQQVMPLPLHNNNDPYGQLENASSGAASLCNFKVGQVLRLQGLSKISMNGKFGTVDAITSSEKVVLRIKGQANPVVVSARFLSEAFPVDMVVLLPDGKPGVVVASGNRQVSVLETEIGEINEYEPEDLTPLEELE